MVSLINLGSFSNVNGKNTLSGSASGIDTKGLIDSLATAKRLPATKLEDTITKNNSTISALTDLKTALKKLQDSLNVLRNPGGVSSASSNAFSARLPYLSMTGGKTAADYVGVTTANGAPIGRYDIKVNNLAVAESRQSVTFTDRTTSVVEATGGDTAGKFSAGTFQINGQNVTFNEGDNLNNVAAAINSVSGKTGVNASIVKFSDTDYRLIISAKETGTANAITITDPDGILPTTSIFPTVVAAENAEIDFNGETITRSSNKISDLVDNVTFSLFQETGAEKVTLEIDKDSSKIATSIGSFVDAYNEVRVFQAKQQEKESDGVTLKKTAILNNNSTLTTIMDRLASMMSGQVSIAIPDYYGSSTSAPVRLGDMGISFTDYAGDSSDPENSIPATRNILTADAAKLSSTLETYFESVRDIFEFNFSASSADLSVYSRDNTVTQSKFTIVADTTQPDAQKFKITHIDGQALASPVYLEYAEVNGQKVVSGPAGSALEGYTFNYTGNGGETFIQDSPLTQKAASITINTANPDESKAQLTALFGFTLATPVNMKYTAGSGSSTIQGMEGTPFAGLNMVYTGDGTDTISFTVSQGMADKMFNDIAGMITDTADQTNLIDTAIENLKKSNDTLQASVDRIDDQITSYRDQLLTKFSALEAAISAANNVLMLLDAQANARNQ